MVEQHTFIASILSPTDALSEETRSLSDVATSSTSSYPDLIAYSAVGGDIGLAASYSFLIVTGNLPKACELPTYLGT